MNIWSYILRRILYFIPIWFGVLLITFLLFHMRDPIAIARVQMPQAPQPTLEAWVRNNNYHLPRFLNLPHDAHIERPDGRIYPEFAERSIFYSQFFLSIRDMMLFDFGVDRNRRPITLSISERIGPSLSIMLPSFVLTVLIAIATALAAAWYREKPPDLIIVFVAVVMMSIALPVWLLLGNFLAGRVLPILPVYGNPLLPIVIATLSGIGGQLRFYRTVFLEEMGADYIRTARARGVGEVRILWRHVLPNAAIPILTSVVMSLPFLITGSLLLEQFFGIPGMGDMLFAAIEAQDFQVIKVMVYLGAFLYMLGSLLTDISYTLADPRVVLK